MAKTRLNASHREVLTDYCCKLIEKAVANPKIEKLLSEVIDGINKVVRKKYPESEMIILRKYNLTRVDGCVKFQFVSGRVGGFSGDYEQRKRFADVPNNGGCRSGDGAYPVDGKFEMKLDEYNKLKSEQDTLREQKSRNYQALISSSRYLEDIDEILQLPEDIKKRLNLQSQSLVAISPDVIKQIKADVKRVAVS